MDAFPLIDPGAEGTLLTVTANDWELEDPQELLATTDTLPPVELAVARIELVVELPVHPLGSVHV